MKCQHKYSTDKQGGVEDLLCISVGEQRQDSLYDQLKDLRIIADNIGCYDASDYLSGVISKIQSNTREEPLPEALCYLCPQQQVQQDMIAPLLETTVGCNYLTKKEWDNEHHPCPINGGKRILKKD